MTDPQTQIAEIAAKLTGKRFEFLFDLLNGSDLTGATREVDRARQWCRRMGLAVVKKNPRRWASTSKGQSVAAYLKEQSNER
jgi:hypothetical protein